jgi:hypothetical protein
LFRVGRPYSGGLPNLSDLHDKGRAVNRRILETERAGQGTVLASPAFERIAHPSADADRAEWSGGSLLRFPEDVEPLSDAKPSGDQLRQWFEFVVENGRPSDMNQLCALVAEDARDNNGKAKPTHLHFTAGQQQFLNMVRDLALNVDRDRSRRSG